MELSEFKPVPLSSRRRKHVDIAYDVNIKKIKKEANEGKTELIKVDEGHTKTEPEVKVQRKKRKVAKEQYSDVKPENWKEVYGLIKEQRRQVIAPVDTMGCASLAEKEEAPQIYRFQTLISLMLSSQTRDEVTSEAMSNLKKYGLTVDNMISISDDKLNDLIRKTGYHNKKVQYIKKTAKILKDKYKGDIPPTLEQILELPGVGPKMAHLAMQCAWNKTVGIGVDVHVHRISNRLGWVKTENPEQTRMALEAWLPFDYWNDINLMLVGFGQTVCRPVGPKCDQCAVKHLCPSADLSRKTTPIKKEKIKEESNGSFIPNKLSL